MKDLDLRFFGVIFVILQCLVLCKIDILDTSILSKSLALSIQRASYERALLTDYCCRSQWVFYSSRTFETLLFKDPEPNFPLGRQDFYCDRQPDASLMLLRSKWLFLVLEIVPTSLETRQSSNVSHSDGRIALVVILSHSQLEKVLLYLHSVTITAYNGFISPPISAAYFMVD